jgi:4a-hydroxytetrahydrobiopterin dehydratase
MAEHVPLSAMTCVPCRSGAPALPADRRAALAAELSGEWRIVGGHHLEREFGFRNFRQAMAFANAIAEIAEQQGHHPDLLVGWGRVQVTLFTHVVDGLRENDFILAAKIDALQKA